MPDNVTTEAWVSGGLNAAMMVSMAVPAIGPVLAAGFGVANFLATMLWPKPQIDPLQAALSSANQTLGTTFNMDMSSVGSFLDYMGSQLSIQLSSLNPEDHIDAYQMLYTRLAAGDTSLMPAQLKNLESVLNNTQLPWRQRFLCINVYLPMAGAELKGYQQLIGVDAICGNSDPTYAQSPLKSSFIGQLSVRTQYHNSALGDPINTTALGIVKEMFSQGPTCDCAALISPTGEVPIANVQSIDILLLYGLYQDFQNSDSCNTAACSEFTDSITKLATAMQTLQKWSAQAQSWVDAANQTAAGGA